MGASRGFMESRHAGKLTQTTRHTNKDLHESLTGPIIKLPPGPTAAPSERMTLFEHRHRLDTIWPCSLQSYSYIAPFVLSDLAHASHLYQITVVRHQDATKQSGVLNVSGAW